MNSNSSTSPVLKHKANRLTSFFKMAVFLGVGAILFVLFGLKPFLSANCREPDAKVLVVEGWLSERALKDAIKEFNAHPYQMLVTTGGPIPMDERCRMEQNGSLIFKVLPKKTHFITQTDSTLLIRAAGMAANEVYAHFNVCINGVLVGNAYTSEEMRTYAFPVRGAITDTNTVIVEYDNDAYVNGEHRNLIVYSINWLGEEIASTSQHVVYDIDALDNQDTTTFHFPTYAALGEARLKKLGFEASLIKEVPAQLVKMHKTYSYALAFATWLKQSNSSVHTVNVFTRGIHARRSRILYQKALGNQYRVGVVSTPEKINKMTQWQAIKKRLKMIREGLGVVYYQFFF